MFNCVIGSSVAGDRNGSVGLVDDDFNGAVLVVVVDAAVKGPVGCAARNVGEGATQVQSGTQVHIADTDCRAGSPVLSGVIGSGVAGD